MAQALRRTMIGLEHTAVRFVGDWPRIGNRPAVDGHPYGVRESREAQTREMALRTAALNRDTQSYPNGSPVDVVGPDRDIGGADEAAKVAELFRKEGVGVSITTTRDASLEARSLELCADYRGLHSATRGQVYDVAKMQGNHASEAER